MLKLRKRRKHAVVTAKLHEPMYSASGFQPQQPQFFSEDEYTIESFEVYTLRQTVTQLWKDRPFLMGRSTISMAIFNSNVSLPEGNGWYDISHYNSHAYSSPWKQNILPTIMRIHIYSIVSSLRLVSSPIPPMKSLPTSGPSAKPHADGRSLPLYHASDLAKMAAGTKNMKISWENILKMLYIYTSPIGRTIQVSEIW